jgi:predicted transposase YbfD/YdcC
LLGSSHDTFRRVFRLLDATVFEQCFRRWIVGITGDVEGVIALDGKTLSWAKRTRGKGNEIVGIKALLETLTLKGCTVTIDAIGCQKEIAEKIIKQGGEYLLALKANQGKLFDAVQEFYTEGQRHGFGRLAVSRFETLEKDHGRIETRRHLWVGKQGWMEPSLHDDWKNLAGVGMVERQREIKGKVSVARTFYIGSKGVSWPRPPGATGELKTACTGCSMSRSARMSAGCVQGTPRAIFGRSENSP